MLAHLAGELIASPNLRAARERGLIKGEAARKDDRILVEELCVLLVVRRTSIDQHADFGGAELAAEIG